MFSGISSGTEMLAYRGELDPTVALDEGIRSLEGTFSYPFHFGYSCVGRVERSDASIPTGALVFAFHPHQNLFVASAADVVPVEGLDPRLATLFPHVETAVQVSLEAGLVEHECVVVAGLGAVGILVAALLSRAGADVVGVDPSEARRRAADAFAAATVVPEAVAEVVAARTAGRGTPVVVEASGSPSALANALALLAHEGSVVVVSWYGNKPVSLPLGGPFHRRRLSIRSTQVSTIPAHLSGRWTVERRRRIAGALLAELPVTPLATHEFGLDEAADAFEAVDRGEEGLIHAALRY